MGDSKNAFGEVAWELWNKSASPGLCQRMVLTLICVLNEGVCNLFGFLKALLCPRESFVIFDFLFL